MDLSQYLKKHEPGIDVFAPSNGLYEALQRYVQPFDLGPYSIYYDHFNLDFNKVTVHIDVERFPELSYSGELDRDDLMDIYWAGQSIFDEFARGFGDKIRAMRIEPGSHIHLGEN